MLNKWVFPAIVAVSLALQAQASASPPPPGNNLPSPVAVTAAVVDGCTLTNNGTLVFDSYDPTMVNSELTDSNTGSSTLVKMTCSPNTHFSVTTSTTAGTMYPNGDSSKPGLKYTYGVTGTLALQHSPKRCPVSPNAGTFSNNAPSNGSEIDIVFQACLDPGQFLKAGTYTDTFQFTVTYT